MDVVHLSAGEVRRHVRRVRNPKPSTALLVVAGIAAVGGAVYYLSKQSSAAATPPAPNAPILASILQIQPGHTYSFTGPLPPQLDATAAVTGLKPLLEALGWTNVSVTSITPGTYTATATYNGPSAFALPPGVTATMVS